MHRLSHRLPKKKTLNTLESSVFRVNPITPQGLEPRHAVPETAVLPLHHGVVFSYREPGWDSADRMYQSIPIM